MPLYALQTFYKGWFWGKKSCTVIAAFDYINSFAEWMSVAMIALSKCINLIKPKLGHKWFSGFRGILLIALIWIYANLIVTPVFYRKVSPTCILFYINFNQSIFLFSVW